MNVMRWERLWNCLILSVCVVVCATTAIASPEGQAAAERVSLESYYDYMDNWLFTHTGDNKGPAGPDLLPCRDNIAYLMESYGLDVTLEPFSYQGNTYHNVVGTKLGLLYPNEEFIIGAHYDTVSNPGADDNASGVALVLEAARILAPYDSDYTIRFVAFSMEEVGLVGSEAYVDAHFMDNILGMISADMVAYDTGTNEANIYGRSASNPIKNDLAAAMTEYSDGLTPVVGGDTPYSDHAPFEQEGFQACLLIEREVWDNPFYHRQSDNFENPDNLNFQYAVKMVRSVVGWLVDHAMVDVPEGYVRFVFSAPEMMLPNTDVALFVEITGQGGATLDTSSPTMHYNAGDGWETAPMYLAGRDQYVGELPAIPCGDTISYYFSASTTLGHDFLDPPDPARFTYQATATYGTESAFFDEPLDIDPGWSTEGQWAFGEPTGGGGQYGGPDPTSGYTGRNVYGYNLNGDYPAGLTGDHLTTTAIDCTDKQSVSLAFWRWLGVEQSQYDQASISVSTDGATWNQIWTNAGQIADTAWVYQEFDISTWADDQPTVYLRWTMGPSDSLWQFCGWNIDDVALWAMDCTPPMLLADLNCDGTVDFADINPFVAALGGEDAYEAAYPDCDWSRADCNQDGTVDFADINAFVAQLSQ